MTRVKIKRLKITMSTILKLCLSIGSVLVFLMFFLMAVAADTVGSMIFFGGLTILMLWTMSSDFRDMNRYRKYSKIFERHNIETIDDVIRIGGFKGSITKNKIRYDFQKMIDKGYCTFEVYEKVPSLKRNYKD